MAKNKRNLVLRIQDWIESVSGQTFLNYAYSWGAAVVILGALFKLTHIPGANAMLFIGMGTEVLVFFISGFDRPAALKQEEEELGRLDVAEDGELDEGGEEDVSQPDSEGREAENVQPAGPTVVGGGGGTVIIGGNPVGMPQQVAASVQPVGGGSVATPAQPIASGSVQADAAQQQPFDVKLLADMVNASMSDFLESARDACAPEMKEASAAYVEELKNLTETLTRVSEQAECMTRDSKEMDSLNRTLTGINTIYEMQLKSISTQVSTIDQINEQARKMARQIEELNAIYNRMIQALTVNMRQAPGGGTVVG